MVVKYCEWINRGLLAIDNSLHGPALAVGCQDGDVYSLSCPSLKPYGHSPAHCLDGKPILCTSC